MEYNTDTDSDSDSDSESDSYQYSNILFDSISFHDQIQVQI